MKSGKCWSLGCNIFAAAILAHALMVLVAVSRHGLGRLGGGLE